MDQISFTHQKKILVCLTLYITSLIAANTLGIKIMPFLFGSHLTVAVFSFPIVFLMTDVIGEVYGKKVARMFVFMGFLSTLLFIFYNLLSNAVPWSDAGLWVKGGYEQVFGLTLRISIASVVAFGIAEYQDVISFFFFKAKIGAKHFWLRSTLSNIWSQLLDSIIFMSIAFLGVYPMPTLINITLTLWAFKVLMGVFYLPLSYLGLYLLRGKDKPTLV
jgi:uncharacterized integral membrane protein (TIGR00697 family)